ncbi:DUF3110 domain-containing protein [Dactylococcopsis salina]|uniref:DUF3110 domain-containing protein n=1 Tax=Dactylococcopsis salina (strain PCC 8305) TaxID=13035 RepID=K9YVW2_DACS8|nr:DUF3110 domain-containing protein [Dactylococcopsis salina]AFZ51039.1 Protein of unknown function (DUF3110) [Dactylococcopsis salina PCC 8305]
MRVYVILFNTGSENQGIHSLKMGDRDIVLMFESEDDATRFALMLEAQDFPTPAVEELDAEEIEAFCAEAGYEARQIPQGELITPPESTVEQTDWTLEEKTNSPQPSTTDNLDDVRRRLENLL